MSVVHVVVPSDAKCAAPKSSKRNLIIPEVLIKKLS